MGIRMNGATTKITNIFVFLYVAYFTTPLLTHYKYCDGDFSLLLGILTDSEAHHHHHQQQQQHYSVW